MKKSTLRKIIREAIKEQTIMPNRGEKRTTGCLDPVAMNYCSVCTEPCIGGPSEYPNANVHPEAVNGCCYYTYEGSQNQMAGVGHIPGTDSFGNTVSIPRDKYKNEIMKKSSKVSPKRPRNAKKSTRSFNM